MSWNWLGLFTLLKKEVLRFTKVWMQTVFSPLITTSLYFVVFGLALGSRIAEVDGQPYVHFVIPGLMMLAMIQNAFLNASSSLFQSKTNGTLVDLLIAPIGPGELLLAYVGGSLVRGAVVGALVWAVAALFVGPQLVHPLWLLWFVFVVCATFGLLGVVVAIYATRFDHLAVVPSFVLTPLAFLGGVFYTIDMLPEPWRTLSLANPVLYMVNGLRYAITGSADIDVWRSAALTFLLFGAAFAWASHTVGRSRRLRG